SFARRYLQPPFGTYRLHFPCSRSLYGKGLRSALFRDRYVCRIVLQRERRTTFIVFFTGRDKHQKAQAQYAKQLDRCLSKIRIILCFHCYDFKIISSVLSYTILSPNSLGRTIVSVYTLPKESVTLISKVLVDDDAFTLKRCADSAVTKSAVGTAF